MHSLVVPSLVMAALMMAARPRGEMVRRALVTPVLSSALGMTHVCLGDDGRRPTHLDGIENAARHVGRTQHGGTAPPKNAGLLPAYGFQRVAQPVAVIEPD